MSASRAMEIGKAAEHLVCCDLLLAGYQAFVTDQGLPYDIILDVGRRLLRLQVKAVSAPRNVNSRPRPARLAYSFDVTRRGFGRQQRLSRQNCDLVALVALDVRVVADFPVEYAMQCMQLSLAGDLTQSNGTKKRIGPIDAFPIAAALADDPAFYERRRIACMRGHPYEGDNLGFDRGHRYCRACKRINDRASDSKRRRGPVPGDAPAI